MTYEQLIETVSVMVENEKIYNTGLTLVYELDSRNYKQMNEQLFYKSNPATAQFIPSDDFEVELGGVIVKFVKAKIKTEEDL